MFDSYFPFHCLVSVIFLQMQHFMHCYLKDDLLTLFSVNNSLNYYVNLSLAWFNSRSRISINILFFVLMAASINWEYCLFIERDIFDDFLLVCEIDRWRQIELNDVRFSLLWHIYHLHSVFLALFWHKIIANRVNVSLEKLFLFFFFFVIWSKGYKYV